MSMDRSPLVTTGWLDEQLTNTDLRVFDTTAHPRSTLPFSRLQPDWIAEVLSPSP